MPRKKFLEKSYAGYDIMYWYRIPWEVIRVAVDETVHKYRRRFWKFYFESMQKPSQRYPTWDVFGYAMDDDGVEFNLGVTNIDLVSHYPSAPVIDLEYIEPRET